MKFSRFEHRFTKDSGIVQLMEDLGAANTGNGDILMLGGGNPAHIPEVQQFFQERLQRIARDPVEFARMVGDYDPPAGNRAFIEALADLFNEEYNWGIGPENIALTAGSQSAFFMLFNMFSGDYGYGERRHILFPMLPEYIGYSDLGLDDDQFVANKPVIETLDDHFFKYRVDIENLVPGNDIGALCVSRPTNPTGNVISDRELERLSHVARDHDIPLIIDNAYGMPFPNVIFTDASLIWDSHIILCMSLSKLGLPGARTGIVVANESVISSMVKMNAIFNLAQGSLGPALALDIVRTRDILKLSDNVIRHYYARRAELAVQALKRSLDGIEFYIHKVEGAIFIWLWLPGLPISSEELYQRLKQRGVLVLSGHYFFPGLQDEWPHRHQCIRISYAMHESVVEEGIRIIGKEIQELYKSC